LTLEQQQHQNTVPFPFSAAKSHIGIGPRPRSSATVVGSHRPKVPTPAIPSTRIFAAGALNPIPVTLNETLRNMQILAY